MRYGRVHQLFQTVKKIHTFVDLIAGNWEGHGKFKIWFNNGGAIEFGQAMLQVGKLGK